MNRYQIVDLDGCISDDRWRRHLIRPDERQQPNAFERYHRHCIFDTHVNASSILKDIPVIVITSRPNFVRKQTLDWLLNDAGIVPLHLLMRNDVDRTPTVELKRQMVRWLFDPQLLYGIHPTEIVSAIDDREDIVRMYCEECDLPARIVRIGKEEHAYG